MPQSVTRTGIGLMVLAALAAIVYVLMSATSGEPQSGGAAAFRKGELAKLEIGNDTVQPAGNFTGPDGGEVNLQAFRGKVVLVNLWATWCPPCVEEMPTLQRLQELRGGEDFVVLAVSVDTVPDREFAQRELGKLAGGVLTFYHDPNYALPYGMGARGFPTTVIYDRQGREIARLSGEADWAGEDALALIDWAIEQGR